MIVRGRHPLLLANSDDPVVPFDLSLESGERIVVVSGPNTGGKSVFLKAVGLIASLTQSGVVPPVEEGTRLPIFDSIFADIGDEQSIMENLSTFSAHLTIWKEVVESAGKGSLVLLDEMGTGTDPAEGAALSQALVWPPPTAWDFPPTFSSGRSPTWRGVTPPWRIFSRGSKRRRRRPSNWWAR